MTKILKKGLVLGGGGAKGCFEIGACQAFKECGIHFDVVTGTSIGALVGAMVVQDNLDPLVDFVYDLSPEKVMEGFFELPDNIGSFIEDANKIHNFITRAVEEKGTDITPLRNAYKDMFDYEKFIESDVDYGCMTFNVKKMEGVAWKKEDMTEEMAQDIIFASAACFPAMPMIALNGEEYMDGGYSDNVPIDLAIELGASDILAIRFRAPGIFKEKEYQDINVQIIEPILQIGNFLDFDNQNGLRSFRTGYLETMKHLGRFYGFFYTFSKEEESIIRRFEDFVKNLNYPHKNEKDIVDEMYKDAFGYIPPAFTNTYKEKYYYWAFLECLAFKQGINPVALYDTNTFFSEIVENGPVKTESGSLLWKLIERKDMVNSTYNFIYHALIRFIKSA
ncbi:MAG: patatin-like phospholipase family protein [Bacillota bacterium]|nr:patatin-like phospholipase family protein [Bacillota bacterium]